MKSTVTCLGAGPQAGLGRLLSCGSGAEPAGGRRCWHGYYAGGRAPTRPWSCSWTYSANRDDRVGSVPHEAAEQRPAGARFTATTPSRSAVDDRLGPADVARAPQPPAACPAAPGPGRAPTNRRSRRRARTARVERPRLAEGGDGRAEPDGRWRVAVTPRPAGPGRARRGRRPGPRRRPRPGAAGRWRSDGGCARARPCRKPQATGWAGRRRPQVRSLATTKVGCRVCQAGYTSTVHGRDATHDQEGDVPIGLARTVPALVPGAGGLHAPGGSAPTGSPTTIDDPVSFPRARLPGQDMRRCPWTTCSRPCTRGSLPARGSC